MDQLVSFLNESGQAFCQYAGALFVQTAVLVAVLLVVDLLIRKRVRAAFRYWMWMLVFVKLLLPPTLSLPTGAGYWLNPEVPATIAAMEEPSATVAPAAPGPVSVSSPRRAPAEVLPAPAFSIPSEVPAPPVAMPGPGPALTWQALIFVLWLVGVLVFGLLLLQRAFFVKGLIAQSVPAGESLLEKLERCAKQVGVRAPVQLRISPNTFSPAVCGLVRPTILIPASLLETLSNENLRAVLIHELAHIKRGDLWINLAQTILQVLYFYNPLVWLAHALVRHVREQAVDEMVLVALGAEAKSYSRTLIDIAEMAFFRANLALRLIGVAESKKSLEGRIKHMLTRPIPKSARVGLCGFIAIALVAVVLLPMARAQNAAQVSRADKDYCILVLDNADPDFKDKNQYDDRLYLLDSEGNARGIVSGLNTTARFGGAHVLAVDEERKTLWVAENMGGLRHYDLAAGRLLGHLSDLKAEAVAIHPATGNAWVIISEGIIGKGHVQVVSPSGQKLARHDIEGWDIAYSQPDDNFWIVGKNVHRVDTEGNVLNRITDEIPWTAVSVSVNQKTGNAWVVVRAHAQVVESKPELWMVSSAAEIARRIDLGDLDPFCVAVDSDHDIVWVGCGTTTLRFTLDGERLKSARWVPGFSVVPRPSDDGVIGAGRTGLTAGRVDDKGFVHFDGPPQAVEDALSPDQKWLTIVPFADARLESPPELAVAFNLPGSEELTARMQSVRHLSGLGKVLLLHANRHDDRLPTNLTTDLDWAEMHPSFVSWLQKNVVYLGKGVDASENPHRPVAYDKALIAGGHGTNVLYLDGAVVFERPDRLERLGITFGGEILSGARHTSATHLAALGKALLIYANDYHDRFPDDMADLTRVEIGPTLLSWLQENVTYLGKGVTAADRPDRPIAYDKTLLGRGSGTNVLYLDSHVAFVKPEGLTELGIMLPTARLESARRLSDLGKALLIWANDHDDVFPDTLGDLRPEVDPDTLQWLRGHVDYLGKGMTPNDNPARVLAYDKTMMDRGGGTNVLYLDAHVAFESPQRLKEIEEAWFSKPSRENLAESRVRLTDLGKALLIYAHDHDDKLPDDLMDVKEYAGAAFSWLYSNVAYVGKGVTTLHRPDRPVAYDKTLIENGSGSNVLYLDSHVAFEHVDELERLGFQRDPYSPVAMRPASARRLADLGKALLTYAVDHGAYPDSLDQMTSYVRDNELAWLKNNAEYLGKGKAETMPPDTVMAYDKTLLEGDLGTNVLYLDCHVAFRTPEQLEELGIRSKTAERVLVANQMRHLGLAAIMYAHDNEGRFADDLKALKPYVGDEVRFAWMMSNAEYMGKGATVRERNPARRPLAYSVGSNGATIAFFDGHVEFVPHERLKELGIEIRP